MEVKDVATASPELSPKTIEIVPSGYRKTEIGFLPEDWRVGTLGEVSQIFGRIGFRGYTVNDIVDEGDGAIAINPSNIRNGRTVFEKCTYITWQKYEESPEIKIDEGDIVLVKTGSTFGKTAMVKNLPEKATLNPQVVVFKKISGSQGFFGYMIGFPTIQNQIAAAVVGGALPTLSQKMVANFKLPLPSFPEQCAITEALSDADALIESLQQLIAKKRQIKQGTMQALLTGKQRLPGFAGDWVVAPLSDLASIRSGGTPSTTQSQFWDGDILWCTPTDITGLKGKKYLSDTSRKITEQGLQSSSAELIPAKSVVMTSRATIGECAINETPIATNQGFKNFVPLDDVDVEFLYYLLLMQTEDFIRLCGGSTFLEIGKTQLASFEVLMPPTKAEQTAIATILTDMDSELDALETRLAKTCQLKQGMMQELLTGRIRLV
ncbi:restriction endonuclease subunit S [Rhodanobacter geophilus]|uniref:Restriction endonuclease subunit S n=1 Tax=Rhodanobacter geophilus TaxID=3162488 RepID=A0ABV3QMU2_9GAMM